MFSFLKEKLKGALKKFAKKAEEPEPEVQEAQETKTHAGHTPEIEKIEKIPAEVKKIVPKPAPGHEKHPEAIEKLEASGAQPQPGFFGRLKQKFGGEPVPPPQPEKNETLKEQITKPKEKPKEEIAPEPIKEPKKGLFGKLKEAITTTKISPEKFEELFSELEITLLENNVAFEVVEKIKQDLQGEIVETPIARGKVEETVLHSLKHSIEEVVAMPGFDLTTAIRKKRPFVICFVGINGSGKTTTIAKIAHLLQKQNLNVVIAAADTFRAAAIDQLEEHSKRLGVKLVKHDYGSDPAAVAFDAIKHAEAAKKDVVLIDTAGRLHTNINLMDEMKKVIRVAKPDLKIFVGESITGNDCVEQAKEFNEAIGIDGIILSKADIDEKGGAALSVSYVTKKPIIYFGMGQGYEDLQAFDPKLVMENLGLA